MQAVSADTSGLESLVDAMAAGNDAALSVLYQHTVSKVFAIACGVLRSKEDAEEVVCDVYTHAWLRAGSFDAGRGSVMAWLAVMARNRARDRLRQRRELASLDDGRSDADGAPLMIDALGPEQILARFQSGTALYCALKSLTAQRRQLLSLAFFQGLSHREIADAVGLPLGTVKSHVRRALATLQCALAYTQTDS